MFWENYMTLCTRNNESPNAVAKKLSISSGSVTFWKKGKVPHHSTLLKIANYFNVSVDYLLGNEANIPQTEVSVQAPPNNRIPVYGSIAAGIPIEAITDIDDWEEITEEMASKGDYIALRIKGNSMEPTIPDRSVVIVRLQPEVNDGEIAAVLVNGDDATCKRVYKQPGGLLLSSINTEYPPMFFTAEQVHDLPVRIIGKVVELRVSF